ncbi:MAG: nitric oxide reductase FlRd-NAD(+) reductase [Psychromonas sp.]|jgi:nitric oxide reductase FlRd-NAD(+) reductase|uniref:NADH:flavorubredoxin reductase NorW n=1 Tax=Psychromonas sp. TaxID=1884585 RepID=UPI0039E601DB
MNAPIFIIGSGFAAYQLIKTIRRTDQQQEIHVFTHDQGHDYNKPDLSHAFSKQQSCADLIRMSGEEFAKEYQVSLHAFTAVSAINPQQQTISVDGESLHYSKLVLATGARAIIPSMQGDAVDQVLTLNGLREFEASQLKIQQAKSVLVIGGGLIGTELAMDLDSSGKKVIIADPCTSLMSAMLPEFIALQLQKSLLKSGSVLALGDTVKSLTKSELGINVLLNSGQQYQVDCVISAAGLRPNIALAKQAELQTNKGIVVNLQLQTSEKNIYALGDCAEINGKVMAYLQPILLSANALAKTLLAQQTTLKLPAMLIKVKTPKLPMQMAGQTVVGVDSWQIDIDAEGCSVKSYDSDKKLIGFIVTEQHMSKAFPMMRELPASL